MINHGVSENVMKKMIEASERFFSLKEEEKKEFESSGILDPIKCGTSFSNKAIDKLLWRDYLKVITHPHFHSLHKPQGYRYFYIGRRYFNFSFNNLIILDNYQTKNKGTTNPKNTLLSSYNQKSQ